VACKKRHKSCVRDGVALGRKRKRVEEVVEEESEENEESEEEVEEVVAGPPKRLTLHPDFFDFEMQGGKAVPRPADPVKALGEWIARSEARDRRQERLEEEMRKRMERMEKRLEKWEARMEKKGEEEEE
jgi:hypothetical protein